MTLLSEDSLMATNHLRSVVAAGAILAAGSPLSTLSAQTPAKAITVSSAAFKEGQPIPETNTAYGSGKSIPVSWSGLPAGTRAVAIVMDDPDARQPRPFVHWLIYNIPPDTKSLDPGLPTKPRLEKPRGAVQGTNSTGSVGYFGPRPPKGDPPHHYHIEVYALDEQLPLAPGAKAEALVKAMSGHVLAQGELVGTVQKR
jgi:Raf kinase inhibitor-like YbhB/YbcL family protein